MHSGKSVALVSDAGMPSICDPGEELVKEARIKWNKYYLYSWSMCSTNCSCKSGFPSSKFTFEGFLPKKNQKRENSFQISKNDKTTILFESPNRLKKITF